MALHRHVATCGRYSQALPIRTFFGKSAGENETQASVCAVSPQPEGDRRLSVRGIPAPRPTPLCSEESPLILQVRFIFLVTKGRALESYKLTRSHVGGSCGNTPAVRAGERNRKLAEVGLGDQMLLLAADQTPLLGTGDTAPLSQDRPGLCRAGWSGKD